MTRTGRRREAMAFSTSIPSTASRKLRRMRKWSAGDLHRGLALACDRVEIIRSEEAQDSWRSAGAPIVATAVMSGRSLGSYDCSHTTQTVPDEEEGLIPAAVIALCGCPKVFDVRREADGVVYPNANPVPAKSNLKTQCQHATARARCKRARLSFPAGSSGRRSPSPAASSLVGWAARRLRASPTSKRERCFSHKSLILQHAAWWLPLRRTFDGAERRNGQPSGRHLKVTFICVAHIDKPLDRLLSCATHTYAICFSKGGLAEEALSGVGPKGRWNSIKSAISSTWPRRAEFHRSCSLERCVTAKPDPRDPPLGG